MNGGKHYDYAMIDFVLDNGDTATCPAKILGFVRYNITNGIPTPKGAGTDKTFTLLCILHLITCLWNNYKMTLFHHLHLATLKHVLS